MKTEIFTLRTLTAMLIALALVITGCQIPPDPQINKVATTFYPLYYLTKNIMGPHAHVYSLVPSGIEPHDYEPTPQQVVDLQTAKMFVTLGIGSAPVEESFSGELDESVRIVKAASSANLIMHGDAIDPHVWLSPREMKRMAGVIRDSAIAIDIAHSDSYEQNTQSLLNRLDALDLEYKNGLSSCKTRVILTTHAAFSYLARDYNLTQVSISGLEPESEPTPQQIVEIIKAAQMHNLKYIFYEELVDPSTAETIAEEIGAQPLVLSPLEFTSSSEDYLSLMQKNLANLRVALECE